jgi:hypothetical protein
MLKLLFFITGAVSINIISYGWYISVLESKQDIGVQTEICGAATKDIGVNATTYQRLLDSDGLRNMVSNTEEVISRDNLINESTINYIDGLASYFTSLRSRLLTSFDRDYRDYIPTKINVGVQATENNIVAADAATSKSIFNDLNSTSYSSNLINKVDQGVQVNTDMAALAGPTVDATTINEITLNYTFNFNNMVTIQPLQQFSYNELVTFRFNIIKDIFKSQLDSNCINDVDLIRILNSFNYHDLYYLNQNTLEILLQIIEVFNS